MSARSVQHDFWKHFDAYLLANPIDALAVARRDPTHPHATLLDSGRAWKVEVRFNVRQTRIEADLTLSGVNAKTAFAALEERFRANADAQIGVAGLLGTRKGTSTELSSRSEARVQHLYTQGNRTARPVSVDELLRVVAPARGKTGAVETNPLMPIVARTTAVLTAVFALGVLGAGCSRSDTGSTPSPALATPASQALSPIEEEGVQDVSHARDLIRALLLSVDDLPTGWAAMSRSEADGPIDATGPCDLVSSSGSLVLASAQFDQGSLGGRVTEQSVYFLDGGAPEFVQAWRDAVATCPEDRPSGGGAIRYSQLSFPLLGDDLVAFRTDATTPSGSNLEGDFLVWRRGATVIQLYVQAGLAAPLDPDLLERLARTIDAKPASVAPR